MMTSTNPWDDWNSEYRLITVGVEYRKFESATPSVAEKKAHSKKSQREFLRRKKR